LKLVPQMRSPAKIAPAPAKVPQKLVVKAGGANTIIGGQLVQLNAPGQVHQINIPGKGVQYIKFVTSTEAGAANTTTTTIQTTKAPSAGTKVIPIASSAGMKNLVELKTIGKTLVLKQPIKGATTASAATAVSGFLPQQILLTTATTTSGTPQQVVMLPSSVVQKHLPTLTKVAIPAINKTSSATIKSASNITTSVTEVIQSISPSPNSGEESNSEVMENGIRPRKRCNCTKSKCLKLYCDCFANGEFCYMCNCMSCYNNLLNEEHRQKAIKNCLERNPNAFRPKIGKAKDVNDSGIRKHTKGCNCKRSGCLKNYCECYEAKIACSSNCKCIGCRNIEDGLDRKPDVGGSGPDVNLVEAAVNRSKFKNRQAANFVTSDVIEATCQCLISLAANAEEVEQDVELTKKQILEEFGRCLTQIISCAQKPQR